MNAKPESAKLLSASHSIPAGSTITIAEFIPLAHYTSHLGFYDLRLTDGKILHMVHAYDDLSYN